MTAVRVLLTAAGLAATALPARAAEPVMLQCGREYQAARAAGTLNGADWNGYRVACAERLKGAATPSPATPAPAPATNASAVRPGVPAPAAAAPATAAEAGSGMAGMHARQKQCGAEWTAGKAALIAETPGLTWPKYWSRCNTRLKTTGR